MSDRPADEDAPRAHRLPPVWFPVAVFCAWRLIHAVATALMGGSPIHTAFGGDAQFYLQIAQHGYVVDDPSYERMQSAAFYPALPYLSAPFVAWWGTVAGPLVVTNLLGLGAFVSVWAVVRTWFGETIARSALITMACWPASMFLWFFYTEALLITSSAGAFWADRTHRRWWAVLGVFVAGLTRSTGLVFGPVLIAVRCWERRSFDRVAAAYLGAWAASVATLLTVQGVQIGDPLAFTKAQRAWGRLASPPWSPVINGVREIVDGLPRPLPEPILNVLTVGLFVTLGIWGVYRALRKQDRETFAPGLWTLAAIAVPQFGTLISQMVRFGTSGWTVFALAARALAGRAVLRGAVWAIGFALSMVLLDRYLVP